ncbi:uncharacterized protein LOC119573565 [Penaeus monodon]|uniref:uncharacterized protein LOC119573565 n=1 Tax=Penaeus monodon TaxID=6687 RepID=UPI0018A7E15C|nr:uncharacterized protein LOC119573565 [Penaeus monodon]
MTCYPILRSTFAQPYSIEFRRAESVFQERPLYQDVKAKVFLLPTLNRNHEYRLNSRYIVPLFFGSFLCTNSTVHYQTLPKGLHPIPQWIRKSLEKRLDFTRGKSFSLYKWAKSHSMASISSQSSAKAVNTRDEAEERFIVARSTKTDFIITSTTTVPYTCISNHCLQEALRTGGIYIHRFRISFTVNNNCNDTVNSLTTASKHQLKASIKGIDSSMDPRTHAKTEHDRQPRAAVTVWSNVSSTFTVTSTSTNSATTLPILLFCSTTGSIVHPIC